MVVYTFYKIVCKDKNIKSCYVGSSKSFTHRKKAHKSCCYNENNRHYNCKLYQFIRENCGFHNFEFVVIQEKECDREEALWIERNYIEELNCDLNTYRPIVTEEEYKDYYKEYYETNREKITEINKKYRENNKDYQKIYKEKNREQILEQMKEYKQKNKDKIIQYTKEYRETNREKIKEYREENRDIINEKAKEKITCECGSVINKNNLSKHKKSKKHQIFISN